MGLKSRRWFEKLCMTEIKNNGPGAQLAKRALELALGVDNTQGHMLQAIGAVQNFFATFPQYILTIQAAPYDPYKMNGPMSVDWIVFISKKQGTYGRSDFKYNWTYFKNAITVKYGGNTTGGGGGDNEFEIVLRLIADFI